MTGIKPKLSIIVPVYKAENHLAECFDSILAQTYRDFEVILVDDGSPDASGTICDKYALKDKRIRVIHQANGGASSARNTGIAAAQGEFIGWVDADDRIDPEMYQTLVSRIEEYKADIAECQFIEIVGNKHKRSGGNEKIVFGNGDFIMKEFFGARMKPGLTTKLYRRELWKSIVFPPGRKHQDCYINMRFSLMPLAYVRTPEPFYYYIIRSNSITTTYTSREIREAIYLYDYTMRLKVTAATTVKAKKFLERDAVNRLMGRYFQVSVNSSIPGQNVYSFIIRKKLGITFIKYLLFAELPLKTRISYMLLLLNMKKLQIFLHKRFGTWH